MNLEPSHWSAFWAATNWAVPLVVDEAAEGDGEGLVAGGVVVCATAADSIKPLNAAAVTNVFIMGRLHV
jgi:hypothetical protein